MLFADVRRRMKSFVLLLVELEIRLCLLEGIVVRNIWNCWIIDSLCMSRKRVITLSCIWYNTWYTIWTEKRLLALLTIFCVNSPDLIAPQNNIGTLRSCTYWFTTLFRLSLVIIDWHPQMLRPFLMTLQSRSVYRSALLVNYLWLLLIEEALIQVEDRWFILISILLV